MEAYWITYTHCEIHSVNIVNGKMLTGDGPHHEDTPLNVSSPVNRSISGNDLLTKNTEEAKGDSYIGETSATFTRLEKFENNLYQFLLILLYSSTQSLVLELI